MLLGRQMPLTSCQAGAVWSTSPKHNTGIAQAVSPLASASLRRSQALLLEAVGCPKALRNSALSCGTPMVASTLQASAQVIK